MIAECGEIAWGFLLTLINCTTYRWASVLSPFFLNMGKKKLSEERYINGFFPFKKKKKTKTTLSRFSYIKK